MRLDADEEQLLPHSEYKVVDSERRTLLLPLFACLQTDVL